MNNMYAFDLGTNNILNSDTKGGKKKEKREKKEVEKWLNYIEHIFLLKCSKRFNSWHCSGVITFLSEGALYWGQCMYQILLIIEQMLFFLLKVTEKSCNKTCINSQSWNWGCLMIYALSFGFDLLKNVACHIIYSSGIFPLTTHYYTLTVNLIIQFHMMQGKENNLLAVSSVWFCISFG